MTQESDTSNVDAAKLSDAKRALLAKRLLGRGVPAKPPEDSIRPCPPSELVPATHGQQRLWLQQELAGGAPICNITSAYHVRGELDRALLNRAIRLVVDRHEILRTEFRLDGGHLVQIPRESLPFQVEELPVVAPGAAASQVASCARHAFELRTPPHFKVYLIPSGGTDADLLLLVGHHLVLDAWSVNLFWEEVSHLYGALHAGTAPALPPPPLQFRDFARWQQDQLRSEVLNAQLAYWRGRLADPPDPLVLPADFPPPAQPSYEGALAAGEIGESVSHQLRTLARRCRVSMFTLLIAGFYLLLVKYTRQRDLVIGAPVSERSRKEFAPLMGFFLNTLPLRLAVTEDRTVLELIADTGTHVVDAMMHQAAPLDRIAHAINPHRSSRQSPIFQVLFLYQRAEDARSGPRFAGVEVEPKQVDSGVSELELSLFTFDSATGIDTLLEYRKDLFTEHSAHHLLARYSRLLASMVRNPEGRLSELSMFTEEDARQVDAWETGPAVPLANLPLVPDQIRRRLEAMPEATALIHPGGSWAGAELTEEINRLARGLMDRRIGPGSRVGILLNKSPDAIVAILAALRSGAAYLPIDPAYPEARRRYLGDQGGVNLVVTRRDHAGEVAGLETAQAVLYLDDDRIGSASDDPLPVTAHQPDHSAYIIFTSGSTGHPKGVAVSHANLQASQAARVAYYGGGPGRFLLLPSLSFDSSVAGLFWTLATGGTLVLPPPGAEKDPETVAALIDQHQIETLLCVPTLYQFLLDHPPRQLRSLRNVIVAGEVCPTPLVGKHFDLLPECRLHNEYGPTEATVWATVHPCTPDDAHRTNVPIGRPIGNYRIRIADDAGRSLPAGIPGEIVIGGPGVVSGYLESGLEAEQAFAVGEDNQRSYATGDLGCWRPGGLLEYRGRLDDQVKINGYRIEPGEVEATLGNCAEIGEVAVVVRSWGDSPKRSLTAYVTPPVSRDPVDLTRLRSEARAQLPVHLVPAHFVAIDELPRTPNGKVDRQALLQREDRGGPSVPATGEQDRPGTAQEILLELWRTILGNPEIAPDHDFFEVGGDSIDAIHVVAQAREKGLPISVSGLFATPRLKDLAEAVDSAASRPADAHQPIGPGLPLTPIQHWFFGRFGDQPNWWNQSLLCSLSREVDVKMLGHALAEVVNRHPSLRLSFIRRPGGWTQQVGDKLVDPFPVEAYDWEPVSEADGDARQDEVADQLHRSFRLDEGNLLRAAWLGRPAGEPNRLLLIAHHLGVDAVSWSVLLQDLDRLLRARIDGTVHPPAADPGATFPAYAGALYQAAQSEPVRGEVDYWKEQMQLPVAGRPPADAGSSTSSAAPVERIHGELSPARSRQLVERATAVRVGLREILLDALSGALATWTGETTFLIGLEGHGREELAGKVSVESTVGWFTTYFPFVLDATLSRPARDRVRAIKGALDAVPRNGMGYGMLRYLTHDAEIARDFSAAPEPWITFNYLGRRQTAFRPDSLVEWISSPVGRDRDPTAPPAAPLEVNLVLVEGVLRYTWDVDATCYRVETIRRVVDHFETILRESPVPLAASPEGTRVDGFPDSGLGPGDLARLFDGATATAGTPLDPRRVKTVLPLTPPQASLLVHLLLRGPQADSGLLQLEGTFVGALEPERLQAAWQSTVQRHDGLRTTIHWEDLPHPVQVVHREAPSQVLFQDRRTCPPGEAERQLRQFVAEDKARMLDLRQAPPMRFAVFSMPDGEHRFVWSCHHMLVDGWSGAIVLNDLLRWYHADASQTLSLADAPPTFGEYVRWSARRPTRAAAAYWRQHFEGVASPVTLFPPAVDEVSAVPALVKENATLPGIPTRRIRELASRLRVTRNAVFLGIWALVLREMTSSDEVVLGITLAGRSAPVPGIDKMVGVFANIVPLRLAGHPDQRLSSWIEFTFQRFQEIQEHESSSLSQIAAWSDWVPGTVALETLFMFANFPSVAAGGASETDLRVASYTGGVTSGSPLTVAIKEEEHPVMAVIYDRTRVPVEVAGEIGERMERLLTCACDDPEARVADVLLSRPPPANPGQDAARPAEGGEPIHARSPAEQLVLEAWRDIFQRQDIPGEASFFDLGGDSLKGIQLIEHLSAAIGVDVPLNLITPSLTVETMARQISDPGFAQWPLVVPIRAKGAGPPIFFFHYVFGNVLPYFRLVRHMKAANPVYGVQAPLEDPACFADIARRYADVIRETCPQGPVILGGYCLGGAIAYAVAQLLLEREDAAPSLIVVDSFPPGLFHHTRTLPWVLRHPWVIKPAFGKLIGAILWKLRNLEWQGAPDWITRRFPGGAGRSPPGDSARLSPVYFDWLEAYQTGSYPGDILVVAADTVIAEIEPKLGWDRCVTGRLTTHRHRTRRHAELLDPAHVTEVAETLDAYVGAMGTRPPRAKT